MAMQQALGLGLSAVPVAQQHYNKVWDPVQHKYKKIRGLAPDPYPDKDILDTKLAEDKGLVLRRRRDVQSDEKVVEVVRHRGEVLPRRPRPARRPSSMDNGRDRDRDRDRDRGRGRYSDDYSDSEGSVAPRSRIRAKSTSGRSRRNRSSSSSSSSDYGSSTEEEKRCKKLARKKWLTAGLAAVATVHAASKVYSSIEAHDKRVEEVKEGTISPEEAHKKQRSARWQDAASIAIAALGIKGAMSEWGEMQEEHAEHKKMLEEREEHHKARLEHERRRRAKQSGGYYKGRDGNWYYDGPVPQASQKNRNITAGRDPNQFADRYGDRDRDRDRDYSPPDRYRDSGRGRQSQAMVRANGDY